MAVKQLPSDNWPEGKQPSSGAPLPESLTPGGKADSAGFTWEGRTFDHHGTDFADDNGETPEEYLRAVTLIRDLVDQLSEAQQANKSAVEQGALLTELATAHAKVIVASANSRLLVPLIAEAGDFGLTPEGKVVEKSQELSIVTVEAPDGRRVIPVFSSVKTMQNWNAQARPIPVPGVQVAIAAAEEHTDLVIIDPGTVETEFGIRRTELEAFALGKEQLPAWARSEVAKAFADVCDSEHHVRSIALAPGDPQSRLLGPETIAGIELDPGLTEEHVQGIIQNLQKLISENEVIANSVDSLKLRLVAAEEQQANE